MLILFSYASSLLPSVVKLSFVGEVVLLDLLAGRLYRGEVVHDGCKEVAFGRKADFLQDSRREKLGFFLHIHY